jgi:glyoxylase-like metal-dependent hydrolase (beta-lactamase superfamily II)
VLAAHRQGEPLSLVFPNAHYVVGEAAWQRALRPHARDRASFVPELPLLLEATGRVERLVGEHSDVLGAGYRFHRSDGHTPGMLLCEVATARGPLLFCADLIPGVPWVRRAITMGYDRYPEQLIDEKTALLADLHDRGGRLFFTHDPQVAACGLERDEAGAVVATAPVAALCGEP